MPYGGTREDVDRLARWMRLSVDSDVVQQLIELRANRPDLTPLLPQVSIPTLVLHRRGDRVPFSGGRILASKIPGARLVALEGSNHLPATYEESMEMVAPVVEFLGQSPGLNAGEPITEGDDLFGTSVQLARRLCDRAQPGKILVADVVRQLVAGKGFEFDHLGSEMLKGFDEPMPLYEVRG